MKNWKTADGQMGGLPSLMNTYGVWYNIDAFKAAGVPEPKAGWTWDDMYAAADKLATRAAPSTAWSRTSDRARRALHASACTPCPPAARRSPTT